MGNELFGVDISGLVADAMGDGVFDVTITKQVQGGRTGGNLTGGPAITPTTFSAKGWWDDYTGTPPPGIELKLGDRKAVLLGDTIEPGGVPDVGDIITVHEDIGDSTQRVVARQARDPAAATYVFQCRDQGAGGAA